ncbi:MAG: rod shape-determining protein MreC, partial [Lachnospiraceae bacterium]|nr:rod shape-determining protein MreC [Lachnospiraceae bacterium]
MSPLIKRKEEGIRIPSRYVLLMITIGCTALIIITYTTPAFSEPIYRALGAVVTPFENGISTAGRYFSSLGVRFKNLTDLQDENATLQSEVD